MTQKICQFIVNYAETNQPDVDSLIEKNLIKNWEDQDNPIHLKHIRDYLLSDIKLLRLYQKILKQGNVKFDDSKVQMSLKLSGVVLTKQDKLLVFNRFYREVFNRDWVKEQLANLENKNL